MSDSYSLLGWSRHKGGVEMPWHRFGISQSQVRNIVRGKGWAA